MGGRSSWDAISCLAAAGTAANRRALGWQLYCHPLIPATGRQFNCRPTSGRRSVGR